MGCTRAPQSRLESPPAQNLGSSQGLAPGSTSSGVSRGSQLGSQGVWWQLHSMGPLLK